MGALVALLVEFLSKLHVKNRMGSVGSTVGAATIAVLGGGCSGISVLRMVLWHATLLLSTRALPSSPVITSVPDSFVNRSGRF